MEGVQEAKEAEENRRRRPANVEVACGIENNLNVFEEDYDFCSDRPVSRTATTGNVPASIY